MDMYGLFFNDTWRVTPTLTFNMGLRYDLRVLEGDLGGPDPFEQPGFSRDRPEDVWLNVALGAAGTLGLQPWRPTPTDTMDVSPRVGFAWDVLGTGQAVIRGSYGIFHDRVPTLTHRSIVNGYNGLNIQTVRERDPLVVQSFFPNAPAGDALPPGSTTVPSPSGNTPLHTAHERGFPIRTLAQHGLLGRLYAYIGAEFFDEPETSTRGCPTESVLSMPRSSPTE